MIAIVAEHSPDVVERMMPCRRSTRLLAVGLTISFAAKQSSGTAGARDALVAHMEEWLSRGLG